MKFRKKPVVIEAFKIVLNATDDGTTLHAPLLRWLLEVDPKDEARNWVFAPDRVEIPTLEGVMRAEIGDWIIKEPFPTNDRTFYPCKPDIFEQTYEPASVPVLETKKETE